MKDAGTLQITTPSDREIRMTRVFDAPRHLVFDALTRPELIKRWLMGPPGWTMTTCAFDAKVGGTYRFVWRNDADGSSMGMGGVIREFVRPERFVATEKFDESWYPGDAVDTTVLTEKGGKTTLTLTVLYDSREARDAVLATPAMSGMSAGYDRLAELLKSQAKK